MSKKIEIEGISCVLGKVKAHIDNPSGKKIAYATIRLSNKSWFDIELDSDGDIWITASENIKIVSEEENQVAIQMLA